ncbi:hypothetical protein D9M71_786250 [compost metagenome]
MHGDQPGQHNAKRADDLALHGFSHQGGAAMNAQLMHGVLDAVGNRTRCDLHLAGNLFSCQALSYTQQGLQFARSQALTELAHPCTTGDRFHDFFSVGCIGRDTRCR